jgi:hypothetical protein
LRSSRAPGALLLVAWSAYERAPADNIVGTADSR